MFISKSIATTAKEHIRNENCVRFTTVQNTYVETSGCNASATDSTYSCWVKSNSGTSGQGYLFGHNNSFFAGTFEWNPHLDEVKFHMDGGSADRQAVVDFGAMNDKQHDNLWHHWCLVADVDSMGDCKLYVDGILHPVTASDNVGDTDAWQSIVLAANKKLASGRSEWTGWIADFAVYETLFTETDVLTVYNGGEPFNHRVGASHLSNNLKAWWQVGDGTEGRNSGMILTDMSGNGKTATINSDEAQPNFQMVSIGTNIYL